jgi:hypothetical protein
MSRKRFLVLGGPGGYLATAPAGCDLSDPRWKRWQVLFTVNRPLTTELRQAALAAALRDFEVAS